ncbi:hypothetical protein LG325_03275 [Marinobacter nauticus]
MTTATIPPRQRTIQDPEKRFYVQSRKSVKLELEKEAFARGTDLWTLGGSVLEAWLKAGCPDFSAGPDAPAVSENPPPSSSPSPIADDQGAKA